MRKIIVLIILCFAVSAEATPICYDNADPTTVTAIGKSSPRLLETCFNHIGPLAHGMDVEFYSISGGVLVTKVQSTVDAIKAARDLAHTATQAAHDTRAQQARDASDKPTYTLPEITTEFKNLVKVLQDKGIL